MQTLTIRCPHCKQSFPLSAANIKHFQRVVRKEVSAEQIKSLRTKLEKQMSERFEFQIREKDFLLTALKNQIDAMQKKISQGSQQSQGEVAELVLEEKLRTTFSTDEILPVKKGTRGGDIVQNFISPSGKSRGKILWEIKRTKRFEEKWIQKLKVDGGEAQADVCVLVTETLPDDVEMFSQRNSIWICAPSVATELAFALRTQLIQIQEVRESVVGRELKEELLFKYLSGNIFRQRVESIMQAVLTMKEDLETEKKIVGKLWSNREVRMKNLDENFSAFNGELAAILCQVISTTEEAHFLTTFVGAES